MHIHRLAQSKRRSLFFLGIVCCQLLGTTALAQPGRPAAAAPPQVGKTSQPVVPESAEFRAATDELREHIIKMREILVYYNTDLDGTSDKENLQKWIDLQRTGVAIHRRMMEAALAEYLTNPSGKPAIAEMLWTYVDRNAEVDRFEGLLPIVKALKDNGFQHEKLLSHEALIAYGMNEHETLRPVLNELVAEGLASPLMLNVQAELPSLQKLWNAELAARQSDTTGEPLPRVLMHTTKGDIEMELFENQAPETVANFISLIESGFYDGLTFHRVLEHFMAQTGCPTGDGMGGPGYMIYNEASKPGARKFFRGTVGMALAQDPNSGGSQFFICFVPVMSLNDSFTAFGRVTSGMEVLGNIARIDPEAKKDDKKPAVMPDEVISMEVLTKRDHEYKPNKVKP